MRYECKFACVRECTLLFKHHCYARNVASAWTRGGQKWNEIKAFKSDIYEVHSMRWEELRRDSTFARNVTYVTLETRWNRVHAGIEISVDDIRKISRRFVHAREHVDRLSSLRVLSIQILQVNNLSIHWKQWRSWIQLGLSTSLNDIQYFFSFFTKKKIGRDVTQYQYFPFFF